MSQPSTDPYLEVALGRADKAEAKYRSLVDLVPVITYTEALDSGRMFAISPQIETILGYSQEEWMGDASLWIACIHPDDQQRVVAACELANRDRRPYAEEYRMFTRDRRILWIATKRCWSSGRTGSRCAGKGSCATSRRSGSAREPRMTSEDLPGR
jgi:PAS domain S-box-containing protein